MFSFDYEKSNRSEFLAVTFTESHIASATPVFLRLLFLYNIVTLYNYIILLCVSAEDSPCCDLFINILVNFHHSSLCNIALTFTSSPNVASKFLFALNL